MGNATRGVLLRLVSLIFMLLVVKGLAFKRSPQLLRGETDVITPREKHGAPRDGVSEEDNLTLLEPFDFEENQNSDNYIEEFGHFHSSDDAMLLSRPWMQKHAQRFPMGNPAPLPNIFDLFISANRVNTGGTGARISVAQLTGTFQRQAAVAATQRRNAAAGANTASNAQAKSGMWGTAASAAPPPDVGHQQRLSVIDDFGVGAANVESPVRIQEDTPTQAIPGFTATPALPSEPCDRENIESKDDDLADQWWKFPHPPGWHPPALWKGSVDDYGDSDIEDGGGGGGGGGGGAVAGGGGRASGILLRGGSAAWSIASGRSGNGRGYVGFLDRRAGGRLFFQQCSNIDCTGYGSALIIAENVGVGEGGVATGTSVQGFPAFAYYNSLLQDLHYVLCTSVDCSTHNETYMISEYLNTGHAVDLAFLGDNLPGIVFCDTSLDDVMYVHCMTPDCQKIDQVVHIAHGGVSQTHPKIVRGLDGSPIIAYTTDASAGGNLMVVKCNDPKCSSTEVPEKLDEGSVSMYVSGLALDRQGNPTLFYLEEGNLKTLQCANPDCSELRASPTTYLNGLGLGAEVTVGRYSSGGFSLGVHNSVKKESYFIACKTGECESQSLNASTIVTDKLSRTPYLSIGETGSGNPTISYRGSGGFLETIVCTSTDCGAT